ncbi:hypothetical protein JRQ81_008798 [Phrynocephalus forsythii]|uniref:Uncharacterized protein n=1 Tax=Phrynocephalus forsythii TaxID=171643 RepID=A0A9Q1ASS7_9SAUR|nr:hypothetical protein JRQ81_008798 [Phrynocephalus forsythii]
MGALVLFGAVAGLVALLAATLLFQIRAEGGGRAGPGAVPESAGSRRLLLLPAATVLAALCLALSLSALLLSLLHGYCGAEQGAPPGGASLGPADRGEWFLVESRPVRHVAVGFFAAGSRPTLREHSSPIH